MQGYRHYVYAGILAYLLINATPLQYLSAYCIVYIQPATDRHIAGGSMIKYERADGRYYYMSEQRDMTGDTVLVVVRGGHGVRVSRVYGFADTAMREKRIKTLAKRRESHGYIRKT